MDLNDDLTRLMAAATDGDAGAHQEAVRRLVAMAVCEIPHAPLAASVLRDAASAGDPAAMRQLGQLRLVDTGLERHPGVAMIWLGRASEAGDALAPS